jgi:FixJ family two-component response regulator
LLFAGSAARFADRFGSALCLFPNEQWKVAQQWKVVVSSTRLVAIVDDDEMLGEATKELIEAFGLPAIFFESAQAFLSSDCVPKASCLVADVQMPGMGGLELRRTLAKSGHLVPVIFVTAYPSELARKRALQDGATCYLNKPFDPKELLDCIRLAIGPWNGDP